MEISNGPTILDENRSSNLLIQRRMNTRDVPQTVIRAPPILHGVRSSGIVNQRRINTRDEPQTGIRESTRLNNREVRQNGSRIISSTPQRIIESITISDDESDDDIQVCILFIGHSLFISDIYKHILQILT